MRPCSSRCRQSWATGESIPWIKVHDLPDFVYFNHEIHVNKGIGCSSCHGRVDLMPLMYEENTLQMEWCLNCHRDPGKNLRPTSRDLQHGMGRALAGQAGMVRIGGREGWRAHGANCELHHHRSRPRPDAQVASLDMLPAGLRGRWRATGPPARSRDRQLCEVHESESAGPIPAAAIPHPHAPGAQQLRDMSPMKQTSRTTPGQAGSARQVPSGRPAPQQADHERRGSNHGKANDPRPERGRSPSGSARSSGVPRR